MSIEAKRDSYRRAYETAQRLLDGRVAEAEALAGERDEVLARVAVLEAALVGLLGSVEEERAAYRMAREIAAREKPWTKLTPRSSFAM